MTENGGVFEALLPVVYFDGERTVDMGCVAVNSAMTYKGFQLIISQKMSISPNQITIYFERTLPLLPSPSPSAGRRRRFPVTNKFDFSSAIAERNCAYFLVVSKKSRRDRRRVRNRHQKFYNNNSLQLQDDKFVLLRRNPNYAPQYIPPIFPAEYIGFDMSQNLNSDVYFDLNGGGGGGKAWSSEMASDDEASSWGEVSSSTGPGPGPGHGPVCDVCEAAKMEGHTASFHWCKLDAVVKDVFRSTAGPIARPSSTSWLSG